MVVFCRSVDKVKSVYFYNVGGLTSRQQSSKILTSRPNLWLRRIPAEAESLLDLYLMADLKSRRNHLYYSPMR